MLNCLNSKFKMSVIVGLSVFLAACATSNKPVVAVNPANEHSREIAQSDLLGQIAAMAASDQYERNLLIKTSQDSTLTAQQKEDATARLQALINQRDADRTLRLKAILATISLTQIAEMDRNAGGSAMLLIVHTSDTAFQRQLADEITALGKSGNFHSDQVANFLDKLAIGEGKTQVYGSQVACSSKNGGPLEWGPNGIVADAALDERRKAMGLKPFGEYLAQLVGFYGPCSDAFVIKPAR